jgi:hypothetical protein
MPKIKAKKHLKSEQYVNIILDLKIKLVMLVLNRSKSTIASNIMQKLQVISDGCFRKFHKNKRSQTAELLEFSG